jgi:hypothetical protein
MKTITLRSLRSGNIKEVEVALEELELYLEFEADNFWVLHSEGV